MTVVLHEESTMDDDDLSSLAPKAVHEGYFCDCCHMYPIVGVRYTCANCVSFDLCEGLS